MSAVAAAAGAEGTRPLGIALLVGALAALAAGATVGRRRDAVAVRRRVAAAGARLSRGTPRLHLIRRRLPQWGLLVAAILGIAPVATGAALVGTAVQRGGAAPQSVGPPGRDVRTAASIRTEMAGDVPDATARGANAPATWTRLLTIERGLTAQQDELAAQEREIARVTALIGVDVTDEDRLPVPLGTYADLTARLASLVTAHQSTQAAYQRSLQAEYDLYRAAAQSPPQQAQLVAQATSARVAEAREAVAYDLNLIQTQLAQEAAISAAEARLQQFGGLNAIQLKAIQHRQPFIVPEVAPLSQPFGPTDFSLEPPLSFHGTFYPHFHTGIDLAAPLDTPIHAGADGVVLLATASVDSQGHLVGYGNYVAIAHPDGFVTLYGHLDSVAVHAGDLVHQGQIIGQEGSTGWSTGPHVHFEIRHGGDFLDPAPYLAGQLPA